MIFIAGESFFFCFQLVIKKKCDKRSHKSLSSYCTVSTRIHAPLGPRTTRSELVRDFRIFLVRCGAVRDFQIFFGPVRCGPRFLILIGPVRCGPRFLKFRGPGPVRCGPRSSNFAVLVRSGINFSFFRFCDGEFPSPKRAF